ncbi:hypothetical protein T01_6998 [Trichinella spiralis]|uniref:Uncharacterized protein n=1 Tax=Trichinella spiralis TaxID=6334 RepID=A0A0V1APZ2_TRISP|nr:hypothetical protein T01_12156 [Trichinella spiralis]KRY40961.1 hypothetical protein T01_6998 [Trichinella spiralis]
MDSVEWLERLEDFLCLSRVPPSDHGMAARYLLSDSVRRELYPAGQTMKARTDDDVTTNTLFWQLVNRSC